MGLHSSIFNSEVYKVLIRLLLALAVLWLLSTGLYLLLNHMYFRSVGGDSGAQINYLLTQKHDVIIFGSSRASHHYNPEPISEATGLSVFNAADDGKNAVYQLGLLNLLLKKHVPKVIIYEIGDISSDFNGGTHDLFPYYYQNSKVRHLLNTQDQWAQVKFSFPIYSFSDKIFRVVIEYLKKTPAYETGYRPLTEAMNPEEVKRYRDYKISDSPLDNIDFQALASFSEFVETCYHLGIKLIFVYSPMYIPSEPTGREKLFAIAKKYGIEIHDFGRDPDFIWHAEYFRDVLHLNDTGANLLTKKLIESLNNSNDGRL